MRKRLWSPGLAVLLLALAGIAQARIISYAPLTDRQAYPAVQDRTNRYYALVEVDNFSGNAQLVIYDSKSEFEPRVAFPRDNSNVSISAAALWESPGGNPWLLINTDASLNGDNLDRKSRFLISTDGGTSWKVTGIQAGLLPPYSAREDVGGPFARGRGSQIRLGTAEYPFIVAATECYYCYYGLPILPPQQQSPVEVHAIRPDGTTRRLLWLAGDGSLIGSNREGTKFLVIGSSLLPEFQLPNAVRTVDLNGVTQEIVALPSGNPGLEGWITPDGAVYLESAGFNGPRAVILYRNGVRTEVASLLGDSNASVLFAVPTADYNGAWILQRGPGQPTVLSRHQPGGVLTEQWRDPSSPEVEAIHASKSGQRLLIQVHIPREETDQRLFFDPALAVWEIGTAAPTSYDELYLNEGSLKGFVHLDVDLVAAGDPFVFDSAMTSGGGIPIPISPAPPGGGGGDVLQEWGVVRASLRQRLVIPSIARLAGAFGSFWRTDLILRNPSAAPLGVALRFAPSAHAANALEKTIELAPREVRLVNDALFTLFGVENGAGALFLTPADGGAIMATSRMYNETPDGTYGMGIGAIDVYASASARFPLTFAGALQGTNFRTNVLVTDVSGRGTDVALRAAGSTGFLGRDDLVVSAPRLGQMQLNGLASAVSFPFSEAGALVFKPTMGEAIGSVVAIDNLTNDPSYFAPDLISSVVRVIPAIAHLDGANGSQFRTDLFLYNSSDQPRSVNLVMKRWDFVEPELLASITISAHETRRIPDALKTLYGRTGVGRLRFISGSGDSASIRITSRLYTITPDGGTYGLVLPPLNSFQSAGEGETLEIMGGVIDSRFRTNLALVELSATASGGSAPNVLVEVVHGGNVVASQTVQVPRAGGIQLLDILGSESVRALGGAVLIRVSPSGQGLVAAFATMIDDRTNDPVYLAPSLASRE